MQTLKIKRKASSNNAVEEKLIVDNIEYKPKTDYLNIELEIENNTENTEDIFEIKIVDKPRISIDNNNEQTNQSQFNLFSAEDIANTNNQKIIEEQHLERDLIKKRISLEMQKNEVNLHELEKEPAYKRYGINLEEEKPAEKSEISNYVIYQNFEENKVEIKPNAMKDISLD
jgi:hypothetical protein